MYVGAPSGLSGPIAIGALDDEELPTSDLPTRSEVKTGAEYYLALAPAKLPSRDMSYQEAVEWGQSALNNYARREGIVQNEHFRHASNLVASSNNGRGFDPNDSRYRQYAHVLGEISGAAGSEYYQVAVELGVVTIDSVKDGKLSEKDAERMGQVTGALVGGVVGQAFGVPAPIGALVGGYLGGGSARIIYHVFGGADLSKKARQLAERARAEVELFRREAISRCTGFETLYWKDFDAFFAKYAESWSTAEQSVGWRFRLRWFDPNPGLAFRYTWDKKQLEPTERKRGDTRGHDYSCHTEVVVHSYGEERIRRCKYKCPYTYGCPYPNLGLRAVPGRIVEAALTDDDQRVAQAFAARGQIWLPKSQRLKCERYIEAVPPGNLAANYQERQQYKARVNSSLKRLELRLQRFMTARTFLQADLLRTLTVVRAEHDMYMNRAKYLTDGWQKGSYDDAIESSKSLSNLVNTTALMGGSALAAYGLWRALR